MHETKRSATGSGLTATHRRTTSTHPVSARPAPDATIPGVAPTDMLWTEHEVAAYLRCDVRTLRRRIGDDATFPRHLEMHSRARLFVAGDIVAWVRAQIRVDAARRSGDRPQVGPEGVALRV